jgi:tetratricopeptide (TPR) repeat protein
LNGRRISFIAVLLVALGGCAAKQEEIVARAVSSYFAGNYEHAMDELTPLTKKADENFVVNNLRYGSAALADYQLDDAEAAFLRAYEVINATGVNDGGRTLGAVLVDEKVKIWKGEPFERAMANFYLGLIYYMRHEYDNARGAFENALFKLRDYDPELKTDSGEVDSNFALATLMLAKSYQRLGRDDLAAANFQLVKEKYERLAALADAEMNAKSNLLLVVDFGYGPRKVTDFDGAIVGFSPRPIDEGLIPPPLVRVDGKAVATEQANRAPVDLLELAQQRRWQSLDTLRTIKSAVGTGLLYGAAIEGIRGANEEGARHRTDLMVAGGLAAGGLLLKATSQADIRQWEMLPRTTFILPLHVEPGRHDVTVEFPEAAGLSQTWRNLPVPENGEATYYMRMLRWNAGPFEWTASAVP